MDVKIYTVTVTRAPMASCECGKFLSLAPWSGNSMDYEGYDDGGTTYTLPDGYTVGVSDDGQKPAILDPQGQEQNIQRHAPSGRVQLFPTHYPERAPVLDYAT